MRGILRFAGEVGDLLHAHNSCTDGMYCSRIPHIRKSTIPENRFKFPDVHIASPCLLSCIVAMPLAVSCLLCLLISAATDGSCFIALSNLLAVLS